MLAATVAACVTTFGVALGTWRPVGAAVAGVFAVGCGASEAFARVALATAVGVGEAGELLGDGSPAVRAVCGLAVSCLRVATAPGVGVVAAAVALGLAGALGLATAVAVADGDVAFTGARTA
jgi:hypothetical protein